MIRSCGFNQRFLNKLQPYGQSQQYRQSQPIIQERQSDAQQCLCLLKSGSCRVTKQGSEICRLSAGDIFGEGKMDTNGRHTVTVTTLEQSTVETFSRSYVQQAIEHNPEEVDKLHRLQNSLAQKWRNSVTSANANRYGSSGHTGQYAQSTGYTGHTNANRYGSNSGQLDADSTDSDNERLARR